MVGDLGTFGALNETFNRQESKTWRLSCDRSPETIEIKGSPTVQVKVDKGNSAPPYPRFYIEWEEIVPLRESNQRFSDVWTALRHFVDYREGDEEDEQRSYFIPRVEIIGWDELPDGDRKQFYYYKGICKKAVCHPPIILRDGVHKAMRVTCEFFSTTDIDHDTKESGS